MPDLYTSSWVVLKVLFGWLYIGNPHGISNMVKPTAARMTRRTTPMKLIIRDLFATIFSSPSFPPKTQNVMKPKMGTKKLKMYTNHGTARIMYLLK